MDWPLIFQFGVPMTILAGLAIWWFKQGWPFLVKRAEASEAERKELIKSIGDMSTTLAANTASLTTNTQALARILEKIERDGRDRGRSGDRPGEQQRR